VASRARRPAMPARPALWLLALAAAAGSAAAMAYRPRVQLDLENAAQGDIRFHAQAVCFYDSAGGQRTEISYAFPGDRLQLLGDSGSRRRGYSFAVIAFDRKGRQAAGEVDERTQAEAELDAAPDSGRTVHGTVSLPLGPGRYRLVMTCGDANSQRSGRLDMPLTVPGPVLPPAVSGVRFERAAGADTLPWPARRYGEIAEPLIAYFETYAGGDDGLAIRVSLWSLDDDKTAWEGLRQPVAGHRAGHRAVVAIDSVVSGAYELRVSLVRGDGSVADSAGRAMVIDNPRRLTDRDYQDRIDQLRYIARPRELDSLRRAPAARRDSLWRRFWQERDPTPGTERNEAMDEYYQKLAYVNRNFSIGIKPGWRSDRGQIYIRYGAPDEVERHPFDIDAQPHEIWYYYREGRKFVFTDTQGFGEYRLTYPRNERML